MNISRLTTLVLISILLIPFNASAHCKGKHTGDHEHCTSGDGGSDSGEYFGSEGVIFDELDGDPNFDYHIIGTPAQDTINAGSGRDLIEGGGDRDDIDALGGDDEIHGQDGDDNIEAGDGDDLVYGDAGNDFLNGGRGTDWLYGGDGNDDLLFSLGASDDGVNYDLDYFDGNLGNDTFLFIGFDSDWGITPVNQVTVDLALGEYHAEYTAPSGASVAHGYMYDIESIWASRGNDFLYGSATDNNIYGWEGDDVIHGLGGNDFLNGGQGDDKVYGGPGNDWVGGDPGADLVVGGAGNDTVSGAESGVGDLTDDELWGGDNEYLVDGEIDTFHFRKNLVVMSAGTGTIAMI